MEELDNSMPMGGEGDIVEDEELQLPDLSDVAPDSLEFAKQFNTGGDVGKIGNIANQISGSLEDAAVNVRDFIDNTLQGDQRSKEEIREDRRIIGEEGRRRIEENVEQLRDENVVATEFSKAVIGGQLDAAESAGSFLKLSKDTIETGLKTGATILENIAGMTDEQRALNETNKTALRSLGYATKAELGSSIDPGRIVKFDENGRQLSAADNVFVGMNRESLRGNVFEGAANRVKTRETIGIQRVEAKYGKDSQQAKDFRAKTETFKNQIKEAENERDNKQDTSPTKDDNNRGDNQPARTSQGVTTQQFQAFRN